MNRVIHRLTVFIAVMLSVFFFMPPVIVNAPAHPYFLSIAPWNGSPSCDVNGDIPYFREDEITSVPFEHYSELDAFGRCGTAYACVGPETLPDRPREDIREIKPSGWHNERYKGINQEWLYNRCHLIGFQLTGQNANALNLITGTRYFNVEGMKPYEDSVAQYIRATGHHVLYRVTPDFRDDNLVASGVLMEALSVEDRRISFCAYCYNVQPGITIDYRTGENRGPGLLAFSPVRPACA